MADQLPNWVYDVVMALEQWSEEHPKLLAETYPDYKPKPVDDCGCAALDRVPADVRAQARAIRDYTARMTEQNTPEPE
jgi:hypothetical protein